MRYFVDHEGNIRGLCVVDDPVNPDNLQILELDLDPGQSRFYYLVAGELVLNVTAYKAFQETKLKEKYALSQDLVSPDRWEAYSADQKTEVAAYRASLRGLPHRTGWPNIPDSDWPVEPVVP